jgi:cytochrome oxidase Cu insertion factor (SCO1/SenC/PrrC family)
VKTLTFITGLAVMAIAAGCVGMSEKRSAARLTGKPARDFELTSLEGSRVRLSQFRGKPVVLAFWAYG